MTLASQLAQSVTSTRVGDLPPLALERAKMSLASTVPVVQWDLISHPLK